MNRKIIILLSLFGILMGVLSIAGYTKGIELYLWLVIAVISAIVICKYGREKLFWNSLITGILDNIFKSIITAAFLSMYLQNNPEVVQQSQESGFVFSAGFVLIISVPVGLIYGLFLALLSWVFSKFIK